MKLMLIKVKNPTLLIIRTFRISSPEALNPGHSILEFHLYAPDLGETYAHHAKICPSFQIYLCTPCIDMPQNRDRVMHTGQRYAPDFRHTYAHRAVICPRFQAYLCTSGSDMPQIPDILMHTVQWYAPDLRQIYAPRAMTCPRFEVDFCTSEAI